MSELRWINRVKSRWFKLGRSFPNSDDLGDGQLLDIEQNAVIVCLDYTLTGHVSKAINITPHLNQMSSTNFSATV